MSETAISSQKEWFNKKDIVKKHYPRSETTIRRYMVAIIRIVRGERFIGNHQIHWIEKELFEIKMRNEGVEIEDIHQEHYDKLKDQHKIIFPY